LDYLGRSGHHYCSLVRQLAYLHLALCRGLRSGFDGQLHTPWANDESTEESKAADLEVQTLVHKSTSTDRNDFEFSA
jgi:hypothetical protein